mmetsp:Transcript_45371/g.96963  ORF Transcript_45371/g.96963 Transcript_45371/m.96963 type:complete len:219 (+) Transcript_45371:1570-2226(+)
MSDLTATPRVRPPQQLDGATAIQRNVNEEQGGCAAREGRGCRRSGSRAGGARPAPTIGPQHRRTGDCCWTRLSHGLLLSSRRGRRCRAEIQSTILDLRDRGIRRLEKTVAQPELRVGYRRVPAIVTRDAAHGNAIHKDLEGSVRKTQHHMRDFTHLETSSLLWHDTVQVVVVGPAHEALQPGPPAYEEACRHAVSDFPPTVGGVGETEDAAVNVDLAR